MFVGVSHAVRQPRSDPQNGLHITEIFKFLPTRLRRLRRLKSRRVGRVFEARLRALLMLAGLEDSAHPTCLFARWRLRAGQRGMFPLVKSAD